MGDLTVRIGADDSQYKDTMKSVSDSLKSFASEAFTVAKDLIGGVSAVFTAAGLSDKIFDTHAVDTMKTTILDFASSTKSAMAGVASSVSGAATAATEAAASTAAAMGTIGTAATAAASGVNTLKTAVSGATGVLYEFGSGLVTAGIQAAGGVLFAGIAAGAITAGVAILQLVQATDQQITAQAILAAQTGNSFVDVATFQNAGNSLGVGNGLLDLLGGGNLSADLSQLSLLAAGITGVDQAISSTFLNASTQGGIEQLVAAFQALPDPIDRAALAVQLFGKNAQQGLDLMNQGTVDAINHANDLAKGWDQAGRESLQRITDAWQSFKDLILAPFDFSRIWTDLKDGVLHAITDIEAPWHTFFVQLEANWHDAVNNINLWLQSHGIVINAVPNLSPQQMDAIMKGAMGSATTTGSPMAVPSSADATAAAGGGIGAIYDQANASIARMTDSYASLTDGLGAAQAKLLTLQNQFQADHSNLIIADQVDKQQALVDKIQATKDALDEYLLVWQGIAKAQSTLSMPDFQKQFDDIANAFATIQQNSGLFTSGQLEAAAGNFQAAMDKLSASVHGGKAELDDFAQGTWSGPTIGYLAATQKAIDDTAGAIGKLQNILNNWKPLAVPILTIPESDISAFQTEADVYEQHLKQFPQLLNDIQAATLKVDLRGLTGVYDAPNQAIITLDGNLKRIAGTIAGTAEILNSEGTQSTVQFAMAAETAAQNYAQVTKNVAAGTATIQDQAAAYAVWAQAALKVQGATAMIADQEQTLTRAIIEERSASGSANADEEAALDRIKLQLSGQYDLYQNIHKEVDNVFTTMDASIASAIVNWQGFGNLVDNILKSVGQSIIKNVLDLITKPIAITISASIANSAVGKAVGGFLGLGARTVGDLAAGTSAAQPALDAAVTAALSANTAAIVAHTAAAVANTTATSVEAAATVTNVGALFSNTAALVATGSVILGTFAPAAAAFAVDSSILFGAVVEDAAATTADAAATAADTGAILGDTAATIADTGATFSDLVAESANTAGLLVEATASGADAAASTADAAAATSDAAAEVANTAALTAASAASVAGGAAGAAGGAAGGLGGLLGGLGSIVNVVSGVVSAISSIVSNFQMAHLEKLTGEIEVTTRGMLNVLAVNGEDSILGATIHTWQELVTMGDELGQLHSDNVDIMGKFDDLLAAVEAGGGGSGGGGGGGGGALSAGDLLAINSVTSALSSLAVTINSQQYSNGGGVNPATFAPFSAGGTATQAYTLNAAVSNNPNGFSAIANPLNLAASAPSAIPGLGGLPGDQVFNAVNESGAALGVSTGALKWGGGLNGPMTGDWNLEAINGGAWAPGQESPALIAWAQANFATPPGGWIQYFDQAATLSPQQQYLNSYNKAALPQTGPTPSYLVPSTPVNSVGSHSLTVNALDPSAKGVGDALIQYLRSNGMKV